MKKVFICSPYRPTGPDPEKERSENVKLARKACRMAINKGMLPLAPHLYFTQILNDDFSFERLVGMALGNRWLEEADELWVIGDRVTEGMKQELDYARGRNIPVKMVRE